MTMSVCATDLSFEANSWDRIGMCNVPGSPLSEVRSSSRSSPASRFGSPSRSRSFVPTFRDVNEGRFWPAMFLSGPWALTSSLSSMITSPSYVTRGFISTLTPTGLY